MVPNSKKTTLNHVNKNILIVEPQITMLINLFRIHIQAH